MIAALWLLVGLAAGVAYFGLLRRNTMLYVTTHRVRRPWRRRLHFRCCVWQQSRRCSVSPHARARCRCSSPLSASWWRATWCCEGCRSRHDRIAIVHAGRLPSRPRADHRTGAGNLGHHGAARRRVVAADASPDIAPNRRAGILELLVDGITGQIRDTTRADPLPYLPLIGTLFLFILTANWSSLVPGIEPPTAHIETDAALALIVFVAIPWFGIRGAADRRAGGFAEPNLLMVPLNLVESFTRTFSLLVRLFGNVMSGVFVIGIVLSLAGLLVPVPLMALELLTGAVQAYIFSVLAMVFIGGAVGEASQRDGEKR